MKYQALLDGLECKEVKFSDLFIDNEKFRIDDEFFMKKYIRAYQQTKSNPHFILENEISVLTDFHANGSYETIAENFALLESADYAYMVRTTDLETNNFTQDVKYISEKSYNFLYKSKVFGGELLINKIGTPGKCYLMPNLNRPVSLGMNLFLLRLKENSLLNEKFLYVFFNTEIGKNIITRKVNGTVPLTIDKMAIKSLLIPKLGADLMENVSNLVDLKFDLDNQSKKKYIEAETLLLENLGLQDFQAICEPVNIKSLKESFLQTGRLDPEYYQPKFERLLSQLKQHIHKPLGKLVDLQKSVEPGSEAYQTEGIPFVRVSDLSKFGISQTDKYLNPKDFANVTRPKKNSILLSKDGTVGVAYCVSDDLDVITSGAIVHLSLKTDEILPDYLTLVLNSPVVQLQAERDAGGSIIQHWKPSEIESVVIPILPKDIQQIISNKIQESFMLKTQSETLLAEAKILVEKEIENMR